MALALFLSFPKFKRRLEILNSGDFRADIRAPKGSKIYGVSVSTLHGEQTYVQFGVPNAFYPIDSEKELLQILKGLLADRLKFAIKEKKGKWTDTTLVRKPGDLVLNRGEIGRIYSWSGSKDSSVSPKPNIRSHK